MTGTKKAPVSQGRRSTVEGDRLTSANDTSRGAVRKPLVGGSTMDDQNICRFCKEPCGDTEFCNADCATQWEAEQAEYLGDI